AGAAARTFIADDDDVAGLHLVAEDAVDGVLLAFEHACAASELEDALVDAGGLDDAAALGDVAVEHGEAAVLAVGVGAVADAAVGAVQVQLVEAAALAEGDLGRHAARRGEEQLVQRLAAVEQ